MFTSAKEAMTRESFYIGVDVSATAVKSAITNGRGEIHEITQQPLGNDPEVIVATVLDVVNRLRARAQERGWETVALGVGVPGLVNPLTHGVEAAPNLPALVRINLYEQLVAATGLPVAFDNDANVAAYGEYICGAAQGMRHVMYVTIGTGIGAGLISEGKIYRGALGFAGELGHTTVDPDGLPCVCGNSGCLETIASGPNLVRRTRERLFRDRSSSLSRLASPDKGELTPEIIAAEAIRGDDFALMMIEQTARWIGLAVANVINLLNLDMVVLGGGVMVAGDLLLAPIIETVRRRAFAAMAAHCRIVAALLGGQAGVIGGAMLARDTVVRADA
jgi:glucokinase